MVRCRRPSEWTYPILEGETGSCTQLRQDNPAPGTVGRVTVPRRDLLLAAGLTVLVEAELALERGVALDARLVSGIVALAVLSLALRRSHTLVVVAVLVGALVADSAAGGVLIVDLDSPLLVVIVGAFSLGAHARAPWRAVVGVVVATAGMALANQLDPNVTYSAIDDLAFFAMILTAPAIVGYLLRRRGQLAVELRRRVEELRAARAEEGVAAAAEERASVALGLHDALAHRIAEISLQAAGAQRLAGEDPARARRALAAIEDAARAALDDIRTVIGVLRRGEDGLALVPHRTPAARVPAPWRPAPAHPPVERPAPGWLRGARAALAASADVLIAAAVGVAIGIETLTSSRMEGPAVANVVGVAGIAVPLAFRRRAPLGAATATCVVAAVHSALLTPLAVMVTPIVLLLLPAYSVAAHLPLRRALLGLLVSVTATTLIGPMVPSALVVVTAWAAGRLVRDRGLRVRELQRVTASLERARDAHRARVRSEERLRIARELHDAVAHSMTVIVLQAGAAQRVWARDPDAARDAVTALAGVARRTLGELGRTLRAIDEDGARAGTTGLEALVARVRTLGLDVRLTREGAGGALPPELDHVAYRLVQEALTNAARHAAPTAVEVRLHHSDEDLRIDVVDAGRSGDAPPAVAALKGSGTGLRGMAERVAACGGELRCGPSGQGFAVHVRLPLEGALR